MNYTFSEIQEKRIREIIREELRKSIDNNCGAAIVENRLKQLQEKAKQANS